MPPPPGARNDTDAVVTSQGFGDPRGVWHSNVLPPRPPTPFLPPAPFPPFPGGDSDRVDFYHHGYPNTG